MFRGPRPLNRRCWWLQAKETLLELAWRTWTGTFLGTLIDKKPRELQWELKLLLLLELAKRFPREVDLLLQLP